MKRVIKCSKCRKKGHNKRSCGKKTKKKKRKIGLSLSCNLCGESHLETKCPIMLQTIKDDIKIKKEKQKMIYDSIKQPLAKKDFECAICWEIISKNEALATTCGHIYHEECLNDSFKYKRECPKCRTAQ